MPHFEKMLYDNAQLLALYAEGLADDARADARARVRETMRGTARFIERELRAPEGGFYTALDADSEGVEGKFYVWTPDELARDRSPTTRRRRRVHALLRRHATRATGTTRTATARRTRASCTSSIAGAAPTRSARIATRSSGKLLAARSQRVRPGTRRQGARRQSTAWPSPGWPRPAASSAIAAFVDGARRTAEFVLAHMTRLARSPATARCKAGARALPGTLDDHAYVADGLFALYEATGEARWLEPEALTDKAVVALLGREQRVFYLTAADEAGMQPLIERPVSGHDGAVPAGASVLVEQA